MSFKIKTNIAFLVALISLGIIGWFSFQGHRSTVENDHLVSHARDILEASEFLRSDMYGAAAARRAYTLWGSSTQIDAFNLASKSAVADFATLRKLTADPSVEEYGGLKQMEAIMKARLSLLKTSVEMHRNARDDHKQQDAFNDQSTRLSTQFTELLDRFDRAQRDLLQKRSAAAQASYQRGVTVNTFLGVSVFLFLMITIGLLNRELSRREQAERFAAEQQELLQSILDSCSDAVVVANSSGEIILRNPVAARDNASSPTTIL